MNKLWRHRLIFLGIALMSTCVVMLLAWRYASSFARDELESQLQAVCGGPVEIKDVNLGWSQIVAIDIRVIDVSGAAPWLQVDRLVADVGLWDAILGTTMPQQIVTHRAELNLRFDRDGNLVTRLPELQGQEGLPLESILLHDASINLEQEGSAPLLVTQIKGRLDANDSGFNAIATIGDALGSEWKLVATIGDVTKVTLSTPKLELSGDELVQLPLVPDATI